MKLLGRLGWPTSLRFDGGRTGLQIATIVAIVILLLLSGIGQSSSAQFALSPAAPVASLTSNHSGAHAEVAVPPVRAEPERSASPTVTGLGGGSGWVNLTSSLPASPPGLEWGMMVYDPLGAFDLLFGGYNASTGWSNQTWIFENGSWTQLVLAVHPPAMDGATMVWDPLDNYAVLFGGEGSFTSYPLNGTWTFDQGGWSQLSPAVSPPARWRASMAWDPADGYAVLFGGCDTAGNTINDTGRSSTGIGPSLTSPRHPRPAGTLE